MDNIKYPRVWVAKGNFSSRNPTKWWHFETIPPEERFKHLFFEVMLVDEHNFILASKEWVPPPSGDNWGEVSS